MNRTRWVDEYVVQLSDTNASSLYIIRNVNDHLISYVTSFTYINMRRKRNMDLVGSFWYNITIPFDLSKKIPAGALLIRDK